MSRLPDSPEEGAGRPLPQRQLSSEQFELVIRRAAELQARAAEEGGGEGVTEAEAVRIGKELGLSGTHLARALAEVHAHAPAERGVLSRLMGEAVLQASRTLAGDAATIQRRLETYLVQHEFLSVQRRLPGCTVYERASGVGAVLGRAVSRLFRRSPLLGVNHLEVRVEPLGEDQCFATLRVSLGKERAGYAAGGILGGGAVSAVTSATMAIAVAPEAALLGLPVLGAFAFGMRHAYGSAAQRVQIQLESLLDRLEHGELPGMATLPRWQNWRG